MIGVYSRLAIAVLSALSVAYCHCPRERIYEDGVCNLRIFCAKTIRGATLPDDCRGSVNHQIIVNLTLMNADQTFEVHTNDTEFLSSVTTFHAFAKWPTPTLSFLTNMASLKYLILTRNSIQKIEGTPFFNLKHLQHLDLSHNTLTDIHDLFQFETHPNRLEKLFLSNNHIKEIPGDAFSELTSLKELDLSNNFISDLNEEPFINLTSLEILRLNNNRIKDLNGAISKLIKLKHLYLKGNQIQNIDDPSLQIIYHLKTFDVSGNQLFKVRPIMFSRHWLHFDGGDDGLVKIILSDNHISTVPNVTSRDLYERFTRDVRHAFKSYLFTELDLSNNRISKIEYNAFPSLVRLVKLDLSGNQLDHFVIHAEDLRHVKYLNLSCNYLNNYLDFKSFSSMVNLQNLDLSHNNIDYIADVTFTMNYNLKYVNMTHNEISVLKRLGIPVFHSDGGVLDLSNNGLSKLDIPIGDGTRLTILVLNYNNIVEASFINLEYQKDLKTLEMKVNRIQKLNDTSLLLPSSLTSLDISSNAIEEIGPSTFHRVGHLNSLFLGHNKLKKIQYGVFHSLTSLKHLDLSFNNITYVNSNVFADLKSLEVLSLRSNGLEVLDYKGWLGHGWLGQGWLGQGWLRHELDLKVYLDDNNFSCNWLSAALRDYNNGYSRMRPLVLRVLPVMSSHSLEGIPCEVKSENTISGDVLVDERLLVANQKILEAIQEQTLYLKLFLNQFNLNSKSDFVTLPKVNKSSNI